MVSWWCLISCIRLVMSPLNRTTLYDIIYGYIGYEWRDETEDAFKDGFLGQQSKLWRAAIHTEKQPLSCGYILANICI